MEKVAQDGHGSETESEVRKGALLNTLVIQIAPGRISYPIQDQFGAERWM